MASTIIFLLSVFLLSSIINPSHSSSSSDSFLFGGCSQIKYAPSSPYEANLNSLLTSLVNSATYNSYNKFTIMGSSAQDIIYGLYQCKGDLSMPDCATCVARAVTQVEGLCPQTCGGALQLQGCFIKYDNASFIGVEDKTVVMKKCGPSEGYDTNAMARKDGVLNQLSGGGGLYRVGGAGEVLGVAQCVGDLSVSQCQDCLYEAIKRLKSECGMANYGDMFLGKCYARYTAGNAKGSSNSNPFSKHNHLLSSNDTEKTFAIIVGLLAAVALVIIFLMFIRSLFSRGGK